MLFTSIFYNFQIVYAFDFPSKPTQYYIQDKANIIPKDLENQIYTTYDNFKNEKNIEASIVTIGDAVGDKSEYTTKLKEWWDIGKKDNGIIIAIYPKSKDAIEIIVDKGLKKYITDNDIKRYKKEISNSIKSKSLPSNLEMIIDDMSKKLDDYSKTDFFFQSISNMFDAFMFNLKPKEKGYVFIDLRWLTNRINNALRI